MKNEFDAILQNHSGYEIAKMRLAMNSRGSVPLLLERDGVYYVQIKSNPVPISDFVASHYCGKFTYKATDVFTL